MRVLVCGSRDFQAGAGLFEELDMLHMEHEFTLVIEGEAKGADTLAREWAEARSIPVLSFPADWKKYGKAAGPIRNKLMLDEGKPDLVVAFPSNGLENSNGTKNMIKQARAAGIKTIVIEE